MPVIGSSICLIENGRLFYRGKDAIRLSEDAMLEDVATLLWRAEEGADLDADRPDAFPINTSASGLIERCQISLAAVADEDLPAVDLTRTGVIRTGRRILRVLAASVALPPPLPEPVHRRLAAAWRFGSGGSGNSAPLPCADRRSRTQRIDFCCALRCLDRSNALRGGIGGAQRPLRPASRRGLCPGRGAVRRTRPRRRCDDGDGRPSRARRRSAGFWSFPLSRRRPARDNDPVGHHPYITGSRAPHRKRCGRGNAPDRASPECRFCPRREPPPRWRCRGTRRSQSLSSAAPSAGSPTRSSNTRATS